MKKNDILRAWRDPDYYASLSAEERAALPANPAALPEADDDILQSVAGGCCLEPCATSSFCTVCGGNTCI